MGTQFKLINQNKGWLGDEEENLTMSCASHMFMKCWVVNLKLSHRLETLQA